MPSYILRADQNEPPLYCMWSTVVDNITGIGSREEIQADHFFGPEATAEVRFDRADVRGTSDMSAEPFFGAWDDELLMVEQLGLLPRTKLREYISRYQKQPTAPDVSDLLRPFDNTEGDHDEDDQTRVIT